MVIVRLLPLFLFPLLLLSAQFPDAASLLERSARAVQRYPGYQYTLDVTSETIVAGQAVKSTSTVQVSTASNDRFRIETRSEMMGESTIVADGESIWTYKPALKQYTKKPAGADLQGLLDSLGVGGIPPGVGKQEKKCESDSRGNAGSGRAEARLLGGRDEEREIGASGVVHRGDLELRFDHLDR